MADVKEDIDRNINKEIKSCMRRKIKSPEPEERCSVVQWFEKLFRPQE